MLFIAVMQLLLNPWSFMNRIRSTILIMEYDADFVITFADEPLFRYEYAPVVEYVTYHNFFNHSAVARRKPAFWDDCQTTKCYHNACSSICFIRSVIWLCTILSVKSWMFLSLAACNTYSTSNGTLLVTKSPHILVRVLHPVTKKGGPFVY